MRFKPHPYQMHAIERILQEERVGLFLDMGLGKTVITLTAVQELMYDRFLISRVLVIAPKRVAEDTWTRENAKWDHLKGLTVSRVLGSREQRLKALREDADVYVIGRDNVVWLTGQYGRSWPFDMIVIDELSGFKNPQAKRFKALRRRAAATSRIVGLTGTPSPNGLMDLWAQVYLLDAGARLGKTIGAYREKYFRPGYGSGHIVYRWDALPGAKAAIEEKLSDLCVSMTASDWLQLPERMDNIIPVVLSPAEKKLYDRMEKEQLIRIGDDEVFAVNAAAVLTKLLQIANGRVYGEDGKILAVHDAKLEALGEILEASDGPVLVFYGFRHDLEAIRQAHPDARALNGADDIADWNEGRIRLLLAHPASVGYGLNLQDGGHTIVWYGLTWSLELYQQANARLHRQGQQRAVIIHHLVAQGTADEQVMQALAAKKSTQDALMESLKARILKNGE